ncbi:TatD family hydrolase [Conchiformibius steedae DSM 2580]|uniref:TatD family hydrolase n=1 Tax=Conchiformibius steedae DSM 2580 TaxID=1121352 RepID=A0AAE9HTG9_9NEIS|nr:Qat anti-phage system TatD family nuclease QatD [Conchiformibius steedae]QMT32842.1 TatD family hydrolase [Conchiformibius steedae]URD67453.1 TatD family hydrolase [Conchiformibius steedae DSM 2580]
MMDMHCHLDLYTNPQYVAKRCKDENLYVLSVTTTPKAWYRTSLLAKDCPRIRTALGLHPQLAHERWQELELFDALLNQTRYVGEIGLDGGKEFKTHWRNQLKVFRHILRSSAKSGGKILSIHSRMSANAVLDELSQVNDNLPILHWFSGTKQQIKRASEMGCYFSVGPAMLSSKQGYALVQLMPIEKILIETDGPFGSFKAQTLLPWNAHIAIAIWADMWGMNILEAENILRQNLFNVSSG